MKNLRLIEAVLFSAVCLILVACGTVVETSDGADGSLVHREDGASIDASGVDASATADRSIIPGDGNVPTTCSPLPVCERFGGPGQCPEGCGECNSVLRYDGNVTETMGRFVLSRCLHRQERPPVLPGFRGRPDCDEPDFVALFQGPFDSRGQCIARADCVLLNQLIRDEPLGPDQSIQRCQNSDGTVVTSTSIPRNGNCNIAAGVCAVGCPCPAGQLCAFLSEQAGTGVCTPRLPGADGVGEPCRELPNRQPCAMGLACLIPTRRNLDVPDRERFGVCMPPDRCGNIAAVEGFSYYRCETALHL